MKRLALGTVQFGLRYGVGNHRGQLSLEDGKAVIDYAESKGMDLLDTAFSYGNSEQRLGEIGIQKWHVVSKLPDISHGNFDVSSRVVNTFQQSLERLKLKALYGILLHQPRTLLGDKGKQIYQALCLLKDEGLVQKIGVSIYEPAELDAICGHYKIDLVQAPFNLIDHRLFESGWLKRLSAAGIELHVRSVFLQGLLLMPMHERHKKFGPWAPLWSYLENWLRENNLTPLQACLRYVLSFPEIKKVVIGVDSLEQLKEIVVASEGEISPLPSEIRSDDINLLNPSRWQVQ